MTMSNGPKLIYKTSRYSYYRLQSGQFATDPWAIGGYYKLDTLMRARGEPAFQIEAAEDALRQLALSNK